MTWVGKLRTVIVYLLIMVEHEGAKRRKIRGIVKVDLAKASSSISTRFSRICRRVSIFDIVNLNVSTSVMFFDLQKI